MTTQEIPTSARVVVVGGGIVGASVAYHLAKLGVTDVVLLEQQELSGGTTWHAAGLVGCLRASRSLTLINKYSAELYANLEEETGHATGWNPVGSIIVARNEDRMTQLRRSAALAETFDVEAHMISPAEVARKWPAMRTEDLLGAVWLPGDGKVRPGDVTLSLAKGAEQQGVAVIEQVRVLDLEQQAGAICGVKTEQGTIRCEQAVLCGGMWTRELGLRAGVTIPLYPVEHHYVVSEPIAGIDDNLAVAREPDEVIYFRSEQDQIILGAFQAYTKPWMVEKVPDDFSFQLLDADWEKFAEPLRAGKWRIPALENVDFPKFVNGPESFTPDNNCILGEAPELRNLFVAAGFNSGGIAGAGGAGRALAEWMVEGQPTMDLWSVDIRRFAPFHNNRSFLRKRVTEVVGLHYQLAWPNREMETGRDQRRTPLHERLAAAGAVFGSKMGWERPNWFAPSGSPAETAYSFGRQNGFEPSAAEHRAARETVAIFDQSGFSKLRVTGPDALGTLDKLCGAALDVAPGTLVYTGLFNRRGGFESDLTILREADDAFYLVTATSQGRRDAHWITSQTAPEARVHVDDVTTAYGVLGLMGPRARDVLQRVTDTDVSNVTLPFGTAALVEVGPASVRAFRVTYVGELGWELHVPVEQLTSVYDALWEAGRDLGLANAGHYAINSLRLEKGYRAWGADISPDDTPLEAGLSFAVAWEKPGGFLGRDALLRQKKDGLKKRLVVFVLEDPEPILWGHEPIFRNGERVGYTTSAGYGHTLGGAVAMGYVRGAERVTPDFVRAGRYEIEVAGERCTAQAHLRAPYDPQREKIFT